MFFAGNTFRCASLPSIKVVEYVRAHLKDWAQLNRVNRTAFSYLTKLEIEIPTAMVERSTGSRFRAARKFSDILRLQLHISASTSGSKDTITASYDSEVGSTCS
jgi:hypothetical protein